MRGRAAAAAAALVLIALALAGGRGAEALAGGEPCSDCETTTSRVPMEPRVIATIAPIRSGRAARDLYRALIPDGYAMPRTPQIGIFLSEPNVPALVPGTPYNDLNRWLEGPLALRVRHDDEEGFFPLVMPVTSQVQFDLGRDVGLPKVLVSGELADTPDGHRATALVGGDVALSLDWRRKPSGLEASEDLRALVHQRFPLFTLNPPLVGPDLYRVKFTPESSPPPEPPQPPPTAQPEPEFAELELRLDPDLDSLDPTLPDLLAGCGTDFSGLIERQQTLAGAFWHYETELRIDQGKIGESTGYGSPPEGSPPLCGRSRFLPSDARISRRAIGPIALGAERSGLRSDVGAALRERRRRLLYAVQGGGRLQATIAGGEVRTLTTDARAHAFRGVGPGDGVRALEELGANPSGGRRWALGTALSFELVRGKVRSVTIRSR